MKKLIHKMLRHLVIETAKNNADSASTRYCYQPKEPENIQEILAQVSHK